MTLDFAPAAVARWSRAGVILPGRRTAGGAQRTRLAVRGGTVDPATGEARVLYRGALRIGTYTRSVRFTGVELRADPAHVTLSARARAGAGRLPLLVVDPGSTRRARTYDGLTLRAPSVRFSEAAARLLRRALGRRATFEGRSPVGSLTTRVLFRELIVVAGRSTLRFSPRFRSRLLAARVQLTGEDGAVASTDGLELPVSEGVIVRGGTVAHRGAIALRGPDGRTLELRGVTAHYALTSRLRAHVDGRLVPLVDLDIATSTIEASGLRVVTRDVTALLTPAASDLLAERLGLAVRAGSPVGSVTLETVYQ